MGCWRLVGLGSFALVALACGKADPGASAGEHEAGAVGVAGSAHAAGGSEAQVVAGTSSTGGASSASAGGGDQTSAGGVAVAEGGQGAGGAPSAGAAGRGGTGNVTQTEVAPGTCGIARRILTPSINELPRLRRQAGGFMAGPWFGSSSTANSRDVAWLSVDASGEKQTQVRITLPSAVGADALVNFGPPDQALGFTTLSLGSGPADFLSSVLKDGATTIPPYNTVFKLTAFSQRFGNMYATAALDGQRAVLAAGPGPSFSVAVIAADGSVIGSTRTLLADTEYPNCRSLQPTDHAAAFSVVEYGDGPDIFHRLELSDAGDVTWDLKVPMHRARPADWGASALPCPLQALTPDGIALLVFESVAYREAWHLLRIARDGTVTDELWDTLSEQPRGFAIQGADVFAVTARNGSPRTIVKRSNGEDQQFPIDAVFSIMGSDGPFASEAGSLFIDARPLGDWRQIIEVKCP